MVQLVPYSSYCAPFYARLVEIAFKEIDKGVIEAAWSMGASTWTVVRKVLLPEAMPTSFRYYCNESH